MLLRERAASTSELAVALEAPKGTVGHHLKVLESAGLIRVVRTARCERSRSATTGALLGSSS